MLLAFKVNEVKNLGDFVYTLEKDLTLNIPKLDGEYKDFDLGNLDGRSAKYSELLNLLNLFTFTDPN